MRLLNARTLKMEYFLSEDDFPPFAILSHTWGKEEVKFAETLLPGTGEGWTKINYTCQQAIRDKIDWVWIDTCCIDKTSSAELTETINSVFRWHQISTVCYAYLADVSTTTSQQDEPVFESQIRQSRWFTRGWTLQGLLAPANVQFYSRTWEHIGSKEDMRSLLSSITRINQKYLAGHDVLTASIAERMSWASRRETSRKEDTAYCLLGIFDINMPLLYGEGHRAFYRLQLAIIEAHPEDHTIFAWGSVVEKPSWLYPEEKVWSDTPPKWEDADDREKLGLLAGSPRDFEDSGLFVRTPFSSDFYLSDFYRAEIPTVFDNMTIRVALPVYPGMQRCLHRWKSLQIVQVRYVWYAALLCGHEGDMVSTVCIPLEGYSLDSVVRGRTIVHSTDSMTGAMLAERKKSLKIGLPPPFTSQPGDIVFRRTLVDPRSIDNALEYNFERSGRGRVWTRQNSIRTDGTSSHICALPLNLRGEDRGFHIYLSRIPNGSEYVSSLFAGIVPVRNKKGTEASADGLYWTLGDEVRFTTKPTFGHTFSGVADEWVLDVKPLPRVFMRVEKARIDGGFVDVVDLVIR